LVLTRFASKRKKVFWAKKGGGARRKLVAETLGRELEKSKEERGDAAFIWVLPWRKTKKNRGGQQKWGEVGGKSLVESLISKSQMR